MIALRTGHMLDDDASGMAGFDALAQFAFAVQSVPIMSPPLLSWSNDDPPIGFPSASHEQIAIVGSAMPGYDGSA